MSNTESLGEDQLRWPAAPGTLEVSVFRLGLEIQATETDRVAVEAPLEVQLHHPQLGDTAVSFGTTMRTPGDDEALAVGLLFGEGIIGGRADIEAIESSTRRPNVVNVRLRGDMSVTVQNLGRRFSAGSSCGVCGTTGLDEAIARAAATEIAFAASMEFPILLGLPDKMRAAQSKFGDTGGIHAAALFDFAGNLISVAEDVGRHNAFDKLVGEHLLADRLPLSNHVVLLSGRVSYELVQKALRADLPLLAAIGAPSSLAVNLALATGMTLVGFLRGSRCNVYANSERLRHRAF